MPDAPRPPGTVACVGALVHDAFHRLLVVRRANDPGAGLWSVPGGRVEPGEDDHDAVRREALEETGLQVVVGILVGTVLREGPLGVRYDIRDYAAAPVGAMPLVSGDDALPLRTGDDALPLRAGDDALDARWVDRVALAALPTVPLLLDSLEEWGMLPH